MAGKIITSAEALGGIPTGDYYFNGTDYWVMTERGLVRLTDKGSSTFTSPTLTTPTLTSPTITDAVADEILGGNGTAAGAGLLSTGAGAPTIKVFSVNGEIVTVIKMDLTGLANKSDDGDIIGLAAGGAAYITRVTTAINGVIHRAEMTCTELPTAASNVGLDFDLCTSTAANLIYDNDATGATAYAAIITGGGNMALNLTKEAALGTVPAPDAYMYLVTGATHTGDSTHTAGQLVIKLYGYALL